MDKSGSGRVAPVAPVEVVTMTTGLVRRVHIMSDNDIEMQVAMARLAGIIECPGIRHTPGHESIKCLICQGKGYTTTEGKSTDTLRFWIAWRAKGYEAMRREVFND